MEDLADDNSTLTATDNPQEPVVVSNVETVATGGQAQEATPASDLFQGIDPKTLPPQAKAAYDSMLKDYRDKTGKLSETLKSEVTKATDAYRQKAEFYDQIATQEEFVRQWNEYVQKAQATPQAEQAGDPALLQMKQQLQEMNQKIQLSEMSQVTEAFAEAVNEKGEALHPEFDNLNTIQIGKLEIAGQAEDFSLLRGCVELASGATPQEKLANGYKSAKAVYDTIYEAGKKAGMGRLQAKAMNGALPPSNSSGDTLTMTEKKPRNAREALDMAKRGQVVSRD
jgi:hypothetical protein